MFEITYKDVGLLTCKTVFVVHVIIQQNTTSIFINSELLSSSDFFNYSIILYFATKPTARFLSPRNIYSEMKIDIQIFTDFTDYTRYTFYETWFNDKIVIVMEKK